MAAACLGLGRKTIVAEDVFNAAEIEVMKNKPLKPCLSMERAREVFPKLITCSEITGLFEKPVVLSAVQENHAADLHAIMKFPVIWARKYDELILLGVLLSAPLDREVEDAEKAVNLKFRKSDERDVALKKSLLDIFRKAAANEQKSA